MKVSGIWRGALLVAACWHTTATAAPLTQEKVLANGLKVIVREDHKAPLVISQVWYHVGSIDEVTGYTGLSHMLEHMMFRGTKTVPDKEFSHQVALVGGEENAETSNDHTMYFQRAPRAALPLLFKLEADRMHNLQLQDVLFQKEREVVHEERRWRTDDNPQGLMDESFHATAFMASPYRVPVIGWVSDIRSWTIDDLRHWYKQWYVPNNATVVVVGDVKPAEVFALAERTFGRWPAQSLPPRRITSEPEQNGARKIVVKAPSEDAMVRIGFPVPGIHDVQKDREAYALDLLAATLSGYNAARMDVNLVQSGKLQSAEAGYDGIGRGPQLFELDGVAKPGQSITDVEQLLLAEVKLIADKGVSDSELQRVKNQYRANRVYEKDSIYVQAREIGTLETSGFSWADSEKMDAMEYSITPAEVQAVARKFFDPAHMTVCELDPQPIDPKAAANRPPPGARHDF